MRQFIPFDDAMLRESSTTSALLVPYRPGLVCSHAMRNIGNDCTNAQLHDRPCDGAAIIAATEFYTSSANACR